MSELATRKAAPVAGSERINSIDTLRGIAVAGILVMNIYGFAMPFAAYMNPLPHTLMLTAIVVAVATLGVALALVIRIHQRYGTLEENEILERIRET